MIDIEWDSDFDVFAHRDLIDLAHRYNKQVVVSYHNFQETPDIDILKFTYYKMNQLKPRLCQNSCHATRQRRRSYIA